MASRRVVESFFVDLWNGAMVEQGTKTEAWDIYPTNANQLSKERYQRCRRFSKNRL